MADAMDIFVDRLDGANGPWEKFVNSMKGGKDELGWLAVNARIAARSITEGFGGLLGMLRGLRPAGHDFLTWMRDITTRFNDWANSARGQNDIKTFMEDALESTRDFGEFLDATWDLLRTFLNAGKDTGDSLFVSMAGQFREWTTALREDPQILRRWFRDSEDFAEALGRLVKGIGKVADALDNEWSRSLATGALDLFAGAAEAVGDALREIADILGISENKVISFGGQAAAAALILPRLSNALLGTSGSFTGFATNVRNAETRMAALKSASRGVAGAAGLGLLIGASQVADDRLSGLMTVAGGAATGFAVGGPLGAAIGGIGGLVFTLAKHSGNAENKARGLYLALKNTDAVEAARKSLADLSGTLNQVTGAYTGATRAAALQKLEDAGLIDVANQFGISSRTMVNAALGNRDAMNQLYPAIGKVELEIRKLTDRQAELQSQRRALVESLPSGRGSTAARERIEEDIRAIDRESVAIEKNKKALEGNLGVLKQMPGELRKQGREVRQNAAATADYSGLLHGIPENIRSKIEAEGIIPSVRGVARVAEKYDLVDRKQIKTLIEASGTDATVKDILKVINRSKELDRQRPKPKLDVDPSVLNRVLSDAHRSLVTIGNQVARPRIDVDSNAQSAAQAAASWLNSIKDETVYINLQRRGGRAPITAAGGLFNGEQLRLIAEAGPEAVVPLNRPLDQVDPSVRYLSAIAQGKTMANGGVVGAGKTVNVGGMTVVSNSDDPEAVAVEVLNRLATTAYV
jgi:hypothetical protein